MCAVPSTAVFIVNLSNVSLVQLPNFSLRLLLLLLLLLLQLPSGVTISNYSLSHQPNISPTPARNVVPLLNI